MLEHFGYFRTLLKQIMEYAILSVKRIDLLGSRKSGKTIECILFAIDAMLMGKAKIKVYAIRNMSKALNDTWTEIKQWWIGKAMGLEYEISETKKTINYNGSQIECRALHMQQDKSVKLTGLASNTKYDYVIRWIDERHEVSKKDEQDLSDAIRGCKQLLEINSCNPWTILNEYISEVATYLPQNENLIMKEHQQYDFNPFEKRIVHYQNWKLNPFLPLAEQEKLLELERLDPISARVRSLGLIGMESGGIYSHLIHKISRLTQQLSHFTAGLDYGFKDDALATILVGFDYNYKFVNALDNLKIENKTIRYDNKQLAKEVVEFYIKQAKKYNIIMEKGLTVYCDYSNYSFIELLNDCAIKYNVHKWLYFRECGKLKVHYRIGKNIALMASERLNISTLCDEFLTELRLALWDEKGTKQEPVAGNDHLRDAFDYAITPYYREISVELNPFF